MRWIIAGDWIKVEKATARKPEVLRIAAALDIHPDHAFGLCLRFWCWCDDQLDSANAAGVSEALVDALVERSGFASALVSVGWLQARNGSLVIPNFDRHLSESAKKRALTARRVRKHETKNTNAASVSSALPREEKRREEKSKTKEPAAAVDLPEVLATVSFRKAWDEWQQYRAERKEKQTPTGIKRSLIQLAEWGPDRAVAAIYHSIANGWRGIFEPKGDGGNGRGGKSNEQSRFDSSISALERFAASDKNGVCESDGAPLRLEADDGLF